VWGNVVRLNKEWSFGTLKVGGIVETSSTDRHNGYEDLTLNGAPDIKYKASATLPFNTNFKLQENSKWLQGQAFVDFEWRPIDGLTLTPGFKYVDFKRSVDAVDESVAGGAKNQSLVATNTYTSPLYFITANYKIRSDWSVYAQAATSFLIPSLSTLYVSGVSLQALKPESTVSYQVGTVYSHGNITLDADVYRIDATNLYGTCNVPNPTPGNPTGTVSETCNFGKGRYQGVEGEGAYTFDFGLTLFANGSVNSAQQLANAANPAAGIPGNVQQDLKNAPKWTDAVGAIYRQGQWAGSLSYKQSGQFVAGYNASNVAIRLPGYDTFDGSVSYTFGKYQVKLQAVNLFDKRAVTSFGGATLYSTADNGLYTYQSGRELSVTVAAKF
jgi:iron complex outermembrane receptor protein